MVGSGIYIDDVEEQIRGLRLAIGGVALVFIIIGSSISVFLARAISKPIIRVADGLSSSATQVTNAAAEISRTSQVLAQGASEQASALEESSSALEELSSMTKRNADSSSQADHLMHSTKEIVDNASQTLDQLTSAMQDISAASTNTSKIVKTIDEIAFQTNLLALNAAVEAARAGQAGAGFAVVAEEVRNLALRASTAAKQTAELIDKTVTKVGGGKELVEAADQAFTVVKESVNKVADLMGEIDAASTEQAKGVAEISHAVTDMEKALQSNASSSEQAAAVAEEMTAQAEGMQDYVKNLITLIEGKTG